MSVELGAEVDVTLGAPKRPKVLLDVLGVRLAGDHRCDHERRVNDLSEAELLRQVVRSAEERYSRDLSLDQELHALEKHAVVERQLDLLARQILLERPQTRVM